MGKRLWNFLGHVFRIKTIGDLLGWWTTATWQKAISGVVAVIVTALSRYLQAPLWSLPLIFLLSGVALIWIFLKIREGGLRRVDTGPTPPVTMAVHQTTGGDQSPAIHMDVGPGARVDVHAGMSAGSPPLPKSPDRKTQPNLVTLGIVRMQCSFPYYNYDDPWQQVKTWEMFGMVLPIRNDTLSSKDDADRVIAHLDFESSVHSTVQINEGWWREDADETNTPSFCIGRSQTKHLVIAVEGKDECFAVSKTWEHQSRSKTYREQPTLQDGDWRLTITITAEGARWQFFTEGSVRNGKSVWSTPVNVRLVSWPKAKMA